MDIRKFTLGLDLGQAADYSALIGIERVIDQDPRTYHLRIIQRYPLRTPYTDIVKGMIAFVQTPELSGRCTLVIDATGVGAPVVDMFKAANLACPFYAVNITGGNVVTREGFRFNVPKRDLATAVKVLLDDQRLRIAQALPQRELLLKELDNFKVKITPKGNDTYEAWREGEHDDLVLATALACWLAEKSSKKMFAGIQPKVQDQPKDGVEVIEMPPPPSAEEMAKRFHKAPTWRELLRR